MKENNLGGQQEYFTEERNLDIRKKNFLAEKTKHHHKLPSKCVMILKNRAKQLFFFSWSEAELAKGF